jgi:hypothetical protein
MKILGFPLLGHYPRGMTSLSLPDTLTTASWPLRQDKTNQTPGRLFSYQHGIYPHFYLTMLKGTPSLVSAHVLYNAVLQLFNLLIPE